MDGSLLVGTWRLDRFEMQMPDGSVSHPYGEALTGYLIYSPEGYMSAAFMGADRGSDGGSDLAAAGAATSYDQFMAYSGPYQADDRKIVHHVEVSSLEIWIGTVQERFYEVDEKGLVLLTTPLDVAGEAPIARLSWDRV